MNSSCKICVALLSCAQGLWGQNGPLYGLHGRILGCDLYSTNHPAFRRYLYFRNLVFFWLRLYHRRNWPMLLVWFFYRLAMILAGILFLEEGRGPKIRACLIGIRDGLLGRLDGSFGISR